MNRWNRFSLRRYVSASVCLPFAVGRGGRDGPGNNNRAEDDGDRSQQQEPKRDPNAVVDQRPRRPECLDNPAVRRALKQDSPEIGGKVVHHVPWTPQRRQKGKKLAVCVKVVGTRWLTKR